MKTNNRGQVFLGLVLVIGSIILMVGVLLAFLASSSVDAAYGYRSSSIAEAAAISGAQDGVILVERGVVTAPYSLAIGSTTVNVAIFYGSNCPTADSASSTCTFVGSPVFDTVVSSAVSGNRTRIINAILAVSTSSQQVSIVSWQEVQ